MVLFIVGYSRSGTKMMNYILQAMGIVDIVPEVHFFEQIYQFDCPGDIEKKSNGEVALELIRNIRFRRGDQLKNGIKTVDIEKKLFRYIENEPGITKIDIYITFLKLLNPQSLPLDTTPRNAYFIRNISRLLPDARFIYMVRDPRDCILSQSVKWKKYHYEYNKSREALRYFVNYHPVLMAKFWRNSFKELEAAMNDSAIKKKILMLRYEDVTSGPHQTAKKIADFLDIDLSHKPNLDFINSGNSNKWKRGLSKSNIYLIESNLRDKLKHMGYELNEFSFSEKIKANLYRLVYSVKYPAMLLLNLNRTRNIWGSFKLRVLGR